MFDAFLTAVKVVAPVILMLAAGRLFVRWRGFSKEQAQGLGILAFWVFLPAMVCRDVARSKPAEIFRLNLSVGLTAATVIAAIIGYRYARMARSPVKRVGVIAQATFRSNMMYVGLPVLLYHAREMAVINHAPTSEYAQQATVLAAATLPVAIPLLNILSILVFILPERHTNRGSLHPFQLVWKAVCNPLVLATLVGLFLALLNEYGVPVEPWIEKESVIGRTLDMAAVAALPAALFAVGAMLDTRRALRDWRATVPVLSIKLLLSPLLGLMFLIPLGCKGLELATGVILLACPAAAACHAMALEMDADAEFAGDLVAASTLACPVTLVMWLALLTVIGA